MTVSQKICYMEIASVSGTGTISIIYQINSICLVSAITVNRSVLVPIVTYREQGFWSFCPDTYSTYRIYY